MSTTSPSLKHCIAAFLLYQRTRDHAGEKPPAVYKRLRHLEEQISIHLTPEISDVRIPLDLNRYASAGQLAMNVYLNMNRHRAVYEEVESICNSIKLLTKGLDLSTNQVHKVMEFADSPHCILPECSGRNCRLKSKYRSLKQVKGTVVILHDNISGPSIGICHLKECVDCRAVYQPQRIFRTNGDIIFLPWKHGMFQSSTSCFYHENTFVESGHLVHEQGVSHQYYVKMYNRRFEKQRKIINDILKKQDQVLGRHKSPDPNMVTTSFNAAFYLYFILKTLQTHQLLDDPTQILLDHTEIKRFQLTETLHRVATSKTNEKFAVNCFGSVKYRGPVAFASGTWCGIELNLDGGRHDGALHGRRYFVGNNDCCVFFPEDMLDETIRSNAGNMIRSRSATDWMSNDHHFKLLYRQFYLLIDQIPVSIIGSVPTKEGIPHSGHRLCYGDGNAHSRLLCQIPHRIYNAWNQEEIRCQSQLHNTQREYRQCPESRCNGNKYVHSFHCCRRCAFLLITETALTKENINHCIHFWNITDALKGKLTTKRRNYLQQKLSNFSLCQRDAFSAIYKQIMESSTESQADC